VEVSIVSDKPAHKGKEELSQGRMDVEEVCPLEIVGSELSEFNMSAVIAEYAGARSSHLAEMDFIEHHLIRVANAPESREEGQRSDEHSYDLVFAL